MGETMKGTNIDVALDTIFAQFREASEVVRENIKSVLVDALYGTTGKESEFAINCDADPFVPPGGQLALHKTGGQLLWDSSVAKLVPPAIPRGQEIITGDDVARALSGVPVLNACVLDHLLKYPHLIPESWKEDPETGRTIGVVFWGTQYRHATLKSRCFVRYLFWSGSKWCACRRWLGGVWSREFYAAVRARVL